MLERYTGLLALVKHSGASDRCRHLR